MSARQAKGFSKELGSPPGKVVWWTIQQRDPNRILPPLIVQAKTAYEAAAKLGMTLAQCGQITWHEEEPLSVGWA